MATTESTTALHLLRGFQAAQEERSQTYSQLSAGFKQFLEDRQEVPYQALLEQATRAFAHCSQKVLTIEKALSAPHVSRHDLSAMLRRVQEGERDKLQATVSLHALKAAIAIRADKKAQGHQHHTCQHGHHHTHGPGEMCDHDHDKEEEETTEEECDAAVRDTLKRLDGCVSRINEALEEVRYEVAELAQE